jgi:hypothetical protein
VSAVVRPAAAPHGVGTALREPRAMPNQISVAVPTARGAKASARRVRRKCGSEGSFMAMIRSV